MFILDITLHMPNEDGLATMDGILSPDEGEAKMFIPKQVLLDEMNGGQCYYDHCYGIIKFARQENFMQYFLLCLRLMNPMETCGRVTNL